MRKVVALVLFILVIVFCFFWWNRGISAVNSKDTSEKVFVVEKGAGVRAIANKLKEQGLINDPIVFFLYIKKNGADKDIQAGSFKLSPSMNLEKVLSVLSHGTLDIWVTVPEGMRAEEIADILQKEIPSYDESWREQLVVQEGYLFPDTYLISREADVETVLSTFRNNFDKKVADVGISDQQSLKKLVIIASMIEREAITDEEKPMIASVIANRLTRGMALDIDATLQYAKGKVGSKWWTVPTGADRQIDSLYNTYEYPGLPPGPISNPGIEAIKAAATPATSTYYFYIHDNDGKVHFSKTIEEHQKNINKYL